MVARSRHAVWVAASLALTILLLVTGALPAAASWTAPTVIDGGRTIEGAMVGVDDAGALHVVGVDATGLFYRTNEGGSWHTTRLWDGPAYGDELDLRVDGAGNVYVAWARDCDCDDYRSTGILYLTNAFGGPNDGWPASPRLLVSGDAHEPSLRVYDFKVHLAWLRNDRVFYGNDATGSWVHTAVSPSGKYASYPSLVVAPATRARIAYSIAGSVRYAVNTGTNAHPAFRTETVPGTGAAAWVSLAVDAKLRPHIAYGLEQGTCVRGPGPSCGPLQGPSATLWGTQIAVRSAGGWTPVAKRRVSRVVGPTSLQLDARGRFHLLTGDQVVSNATGTIVRRTLGLGAYASWFAMDITDGGKARVIYTDDEGPGSHLLLVREH